MVFMAQMVVPVGTTNFIYDGPLVRDSSFWAVVPIQIENALITNLKVLDRFDVTQDDGIDVCESTNVTVRRAITVSNDDSYSAKTWPYMVGTTVPYPYNPRPLSNVLFEDLLSWTYCYSFKIGQGVWESQNNVTFRDGVTYRAGVGIGIDHLFGTSSASNITWENIDLQTVSGDPGGNGGWLSILVQIDGDDGVGPIEDIFVKNIRAREQGSLPCAIDGYNSSAMVTGVTISDVYMYANTTAATTLKEMNILTTNFSSGIEIVNS